MNPGRELDALIAEKVMGLKTIDGKILKSRSLGSGRAFFNGVPIGETQSVEMNFMEDPKSYSTDIAAAWEVVEKLADQWPISVRKLPAESWQASTGMLPWIDGDTAPHAICLAALKSLELIKP